MIPEVPWLQSDSDLITLVETRSHSYAHSAARYARR